MSRFLMVDIGAGTMDILFYDDESELHYKAVVRSPVLTLAEKVKRTTGNLLVTGCEMGGGPVTVELRKRAESARVVMTEGAANTLNHDLEKVRSWGVQVIGEEEVCNYEQSGSFHRLEIGDLEQARLEAIVTGFGVPFSFDILGICAQDHGMPPPGLSHLDYRHLLFQEKLDQEPLPHTMLYGADAVPKTLNRLHSISRCAGTLPAGEIYVMDSGMAAIVGASLDRLAENKKRLLVLDIATSHTVGAALIEGELAGFFEYHTRDITLSRLEELLRDLADGRLSQREILQEGGHGAYVRKSFGFENTEAIIATGPKRRLILDSNLPIRYGSPWGDNMMTGTVGLLESIRRKKSLSPPLSLYL